MTASSQRDWGSWDAIPWWDRALHWGYQLWDVWVDGHQQCLFSVLAQMVWATSSRLGCALGTCANVRVWGSTWRHAILLVCNYAIK